MDVLPYNMSMAKIYTGTEDACAHVTSEWATYRFGLGDDLGLFARRVIRIAVARVGVHVAQVGAHALLTHAARRPPVDSQNKTQ